MMFKCLGKLKKRNLKNFYIEFVIFLFLTHSL